MALLTADQLPPPPAGLTADQLPPPPPAATGSAGAPQLVQAQDLPPPTTEGITAAQLPPPPDEITKKTSEVLTDSDITRIASKYGVDPEELKKLAPYYGAAIQPHTAGETLATAGRTAAGILGRGAALGIPQFAYKKAQPEPMKKALDEITRIGEEQAPLTSKVAEGLFLPAGGAESALSSTAARRIGTAATIGGVSGVTSSEEGKEVSGGLTGAAIGAGLGVAGEGISRALSKQEQKLAQDATPVEQEVFRKSKLAQVDVQKAAEQSAAETQKADAVLENSIINRKTPSVRDIEQIADDYMPERTREAIETSSDPYGKMYEYGTKVWQDHILDFAEDLSGTRPETTQEAFKLIDEYASGQGGLPAVQNKLNNYLEEFHATRGIQKGGLEIQGTGKFTERAGNVISTKEPVLRAIDERAGTRTEQILEQANTNINKRAAARKYFDKQLENLVDSTDRSVLTPEAKFRISRALNTGDLSGLSQEEVKAVQGLRQGYDEVRNFANGVEGRVSLDKEITPLSIGKLEGPGYEFKTLKEAQELIPAVQMQEQKALQEASNILGTKVDSFAELSPEDVLKIQDNQEVQKLMWPLKTLEGVNTSSGMGIQNGLRRVYGKEGRIGLETKARAALQRGPEGIPEYLLEKDPFKLLQKYTDNTLNHLYLREPTDALASQARILRKAGDEYGARYVENTIRDMRGSRSGSLPAEWQQRKVQIFLAMDKLADKVGRDTPAGQVILAAKNVPSILQNLTHRIYENTMGWNVRSSIQGQLQTLTKTWPELGLQYGTDNLLKAGTKVVLDRNKYLQEAQRMGLLQPQYQDGAEQALAEGIKRTALFKMSKKVLDTNAKLSMAMHQFAENNNRAIAVAAAEQMSEDISKNTPLALRALKDFPENLQKRILQNPQDLEGNKKALARYLVGQTQYFYSKASMSEFGAIMGPAFTPFTKWPSATAGDIIYEFRSKGIPRASARVAAKYLAPWLLLEGIQHTLIGPPGEESDRQRAIVGSKGLSQASPIGTVGAIATGEVLTPPVVKQLVDTVIIPAYTGQTDRMSRGIDSMFMTYTPGAGTYKALTETLPTLVEGERPVK